MKHADHSFSDATFIDENTPLLLSRFSLSYHREFSCVDYYVKSIETGLCISKDILFSLDRIERRIVVSRFYPELAKQEHSKYLSATCFFLMIHHFAKIVNVTSEFDMYLTAKPLVFRSFYEKLKDFHFHVQGPKTETYLQVASALDRVVVDTSMITRSLEN
jgi:hypothetical protein